MESMGFQTPRKREEKVPPLRKAGDGEVPASTLLYTGLRYTSLWHPITWHKDRPRLWLEANPKPLRALCTAEVGRNLGVDFLFWFSNFSFLVMFTGFSVIYMTEFWTQLTLCPVNKAIWFCKWPNPLSWASNSLFPSNSYVRLCNLAECLDSS